MFRPAFNRTDRPLLIDAAGHQLGGREWGAVDDSTDEVQAAIARRELRVYETIAEDASDDAKAAAARAAELGAPSSSPRRRTSSAPELPTAPEA